MPKDDKNKKRSWRDVVSGRNPELNMDDEDAVASYMEETFNNYDRMEGDQRQLNDLLTRDPQAAGILTGLSSGMDDNNQPFSLTAYLLDNYYDEIVNSESKEEAIEKARKKEAQHLRHRAAVALRKGAGEGEALGDEGLVDDGGDRFELCGVEAAPLFQTHHIALHRSAAEGDADAAALLYAVGGDVFKYPVDLAVRDVYDHFRRHA